MNLHSLPPLFAAAVFLLVALFVYSRAKPNPVNKIFAIMLLCISLWNVEWVGIIAGPNPDFVHHWAQIFRIPVLFIPPTFLHFATLFTNPSGMSRRDRKTIFVFYGISCFLLVINWTHGFHGDVVTYPWGYSVKMGPLYVLYILQFIIAVLIAFYYLFHGYTRANSYHRQRLKYFTLSISLSFVLGGAPNFLLILGIKGYPFGNIAAGIGLLIMAYSIVQHRLMDVSVFFAKGMGYILSIAILVVPAALIIICLEKYFFQDIDTGFSGIVLGMGVVAALVFNRVKGHMDRAMQQMIVKDKYDYHRILEEFSRRLVTIVDSNRLLQMLADTIEKSMGVTQMSIFLHEPERDEFRSHLIRGVPKEEPLKISDRAIQSLQGKKGAILRVELEEGREGSAESEIRKIVEHLQAEVCLPLIYLDRLIGFINLGPKTAGGMYYTEDLNLLNFLANQVAIGIENANLYENLKKSQNIMRRADRLASLGTLIASLAHEIRNPLVSIKTFTQLLPERIDDEEFRSYFLKVATGEIDRLTGLINELLGFARPSEPRPQGEDINAIIDQMEVLVSTEARKKNITLSKKYASNLPKVNVDAEQIKQVLLNILLNAIQAIKGEGKVWIETRMVQMPGEDKIDPYVQVEIRDTGVGIPKENLERIFDPFFSTRPEGSGLGLAISHQIIHEHGGFINVDSEVGKGTSFKVHLALKEGRKVAAQN